MKPKNIAFVITLNLHQILGYNKIEKLLLLIFYLKKEMETTDLINFDEVYELQQPIMYSSEQELFETKRKLSLLEEKLNKLELEEKFDKMELEERINKLEEQNKHNISILPIAFYVALPNNSEFATFDVFPTQTPQYTTKWIFCDINSKKLIINPSYLMLDDLKLFDFSKDSIPPNFVTFISQFQNIKIIEFNNIQANSYCPIPYLLINELLINSTHKFDIIFKTTKLYDIPSGKIFELFEIFKKSTNYKKLHIEVKDNLVVSGINAYYVSQPYVNETKEHCIRNNIEFTSNIGI